ncbi:MAG: YihY/virulence factor BrkB family protein [Candidatus Dormibacteria bacterium]
MPALAKRVLHRLLASFPGRVGRRYLEAKGGTWAQVVAWNALFAFFPMVLVAVTLLGLLLRDPGIASSIETKVAAAVGGSLEDQKAIFDAFQAFKNRTGVLALVAFAGLVWSGSALIGAFDEAVNSLYPCSPRDFLRQKLMSVGMMLIFTVLTVPLVLSSSLLALLRDVPGLPDLLASEPVAFVLQAVLGVVDGALLFGAIYYIVPNRRQRLRRTLPGALVGGVLLEALTLLFPLYFRVSGGFATYGKTFALFFVLLTYFYFLGQIVMVGATVNAELDPDSGECAAEPQSTGVEPRPGVARSPEEAGIRGTLPA